MKHLYLLSFCLLIACQPSVSNLEPVLTPQTSGTGALLQAISIVDPDTVWVSGHAGTYGRTLNGGNDWQFWQMAGADTLQFRDVHAFNANHVLLMAAGPGALSQIRRTTDGGESWELVYLMPESEGFLNTIELWENGYGLALGDALADGLFLLRTEDFGNSWQRISPSSLPLPLGKEGGFAASGTCIALGTEGKAWVGTGAGEYPRVLSTADYGKSWDWVAAPIVKGGAAGITSIRFWDDQHGVIVGGDLGKPEGHTQNVAISSDGGKSWELTGQPFTEGSFYGSAVFQQGNGYWLLACGPNGMDATNNGGKTWINLDSANLWALDIHKQGVGWATGKGGQIKKINFVEKQ